jgi:hypothetical protein
MYLHAMKYPAIQYKWVDLESFILHEVQNVSRLFLLNFERKRKWSITSQKYKERRGSSFCSDSVNKKLQPHKVITFKPLE